MRAKMVSGRMGDELLFNHSAGRQASARRRHLGRQLLQLRKAADRTQLQLAVHLHCEQSKIAKIEGSLVEVQPGELEAILDFCGCSEEKKDQLRELHCGSLIPRALPGAPQEGDAFSKMADLEGEAREILSYHGEQLPCPLQSEPYMLKQHNLDKLGPADSRDVVDWSIAERQARQAVFKAEQAPRYRAIISESALNRLPGGWTAHLMLETVNHLKSLMVHHEQFELQILPFKSPVPYVHTDFTVLMFPRPTSDDYIPPGDFGYVEHIKEGRTFGNIKAYQEYWQELHEVALGREGTIEFLDSHIKELSGELMDGSSDRAEDG
jgi:transcriptional regulator with XRE-family HTH domain